MQPSIPDVKYQLQKFRHAQKAKFFGFKSLDFSATFVCFNLLPFFFSLAGHLPGFISEGKNFWYKALRIVGVDGRK